MTPAELIALAEKHNILIPNAFDKDSFEETSGWTDKKWERFINYYGYDENDDAIKESIEYFEEQDEEEADQEEERYCDNVDCPYGGNCFGDLKKQHEGKPFICVGCTTGKGLQEQEEEEEEPKVIVDPEKIWVMCGTMKEMWWKVMLQTRATMLIEGIPFDNIIVKGLTDRQLEVLGRFVSKCKKSD